MITVAHNLAAMNLQRQFGINTKKDKKVNERLASGYRINRAADDAAGLTISEKMRAQIRGLNQGTENAQDGISWVQIGDGALNEVHDMLHRMNELSIQALNGTYTDQDRAAMEAEFNQLQCQIDSITQNAKFNEQHIFAEHEPTYYEVEGNISWPHDMEHNIFSPENTLEVSYRVQPDDPPQTVTITVPEGTYTTKELADEIEDAIADSPLGYDPKLNFAYSPGGTFSANIEGASRIESVSGGLAGLLNKTNSGGSTGALIGTTSFLNDSVKLDIRRGKNDHMSFTIEDFSGHTSTKEINIPAGSYNRGQLIDLLNNALTGTGVQATKYGSGIMLSGDDCIISRFKGNMFQIDGAANTSVFYDNVYHGEVSLTPATFTGGDVLPTSSYMNGRDEEHGSFVIKSGVNDTLTFAPDGSSNPVTITIPQGSYKIGEMVTKLNSLFSSNGLGLKATSHQTGDFAGLTITSNLKGATSDVGIDQSSSTAFDTLFVDRTYNVYSNNSTVTNINTKDRPATYSAGKSFTSTYYENLPLKVEEGVNDSFRLAIGNNSYDITLAAQTYSSVDAINNAINSALNSQSLGTDAGKVVSSVSGGSIVLSTVDSARITSMSAGKVPGNTGFEDIFQRSYRYTERAVNTNSIKLDRTFDDPGPIYDYEKNIRIESTDREVRYDIELPVGDSVSHQQIINKIAETSGVSQYTDIRYMQSYDDGRDYNFSSSGNGGTTVNSQNYNSTGVTVGKQIEGQVGYVYTRNDPASVTIQLPSRFTPAAGTDELVLSLNGKQRTIRFDHTEYTPATFASKLQQEIDREYGQYFGGATVSASGSGITITSRLNDSEGNVQRGDNTTISCSTGTSSLLREINTTRTPAVLTTSNTYRMPSAGINVADGDTFEFTLNNVRQSVNLSSLTNASASSFVNMLNNRMSAQNIPVTASLVSSGSGYRLRLTTNDVGSGNSISYSSASGGTVTKALFGELQTSGSAWNYDKQVQNSFTIEEDKNVFRFSADGLNKSVTLTPNTYDRNSFLSELNSKLAASSAGVTADYSSAGILRLTSNSKGTGSKVRMPYDSSADSAMRAIWGQTESKAPKLTAEFDDTNHLILRSEDGTQFRISSSSTPTFERNKISSYGTPSAQSGYYSNDHATMKGGPLTISTASPLTINEWNDTLEFHYFKDDTYSTVSVNVPHGAYTSYDDLQQALQTKLDDAVGTGEINVSVSSSGVVIEAAKTGYSRAFGSMATTARSVTPAKYGDFYDKVMNSTTERTVKQSTASTVGSNVAGTDKIPYVNGRRNVKDNPVEIKAGINDTLMLDFTYPGSSTKTFTMKLDPGKYQGDSLVNMIQDKLNGQLRAAGLAENLIEVGIGGTNANVANVDNSKVLTFKLSNSLPLPSSGEYVIDALGGNAAFSVFYQTTGELVPAYIEGVRDLRDGVVIEDEHNTFSFKVDDRTYSIDVDPGEYTANEIIDKLNSLLSAKGAPIVAEQTEEGRLKLSHKQMGKHPITDLSGSARGSLFFNEYGAIDEERDVRLQFSSVLDDHKYIERPIVSTSFLGINSVTISKLKYAGKANERLHDALDRVSSVRSYFGASQNAIEHVVNRNNITVENTQASESLLRDTEMAHAMVEHSKNQILMQAGLSILAQANTSTQSVLQLLQ